MRLKAILFCLTPVLLAAPSLANTVTISPGDDVVAKWSTVSAGDTVDFDPGNYTITAPLTVPTGVTVTSTEGKPDNTFLSFHLDGGDKTSYGFIIVGGASAVTITELDLVSNHGVVQMSDGTLYTNVHIIRDNIAYGSGQLSDGTLVFGISGTVKNNGLQISHNYFHDSQNTIRNWSVWFATNANFDYNVFYNVNDGGQIDNPGANVTFSHNYGTLLHRMGQEAALESDSTFTADGNVFYDYVLPYNDTEGMSIIGVSSTVNLTNNYLKASIAAGSTWGQADGGGNHRFGYAIEGTGAAGSLVGGNTIIGPWADFVSSDISNLNVSGNSVYGTALWGSFEGEPGPYGYGSVNTSGGNKSDTNVGDAPAAPANDSTFGAGVSGTGVSVGAGGDPNGLIPNGSTSAGSGGYAPTPVVVPPSVTGLQIVQGSGGPGTYELKWTNPSVNVTSITIQMISAVRRETFSTVTIGSTNHFDLTNMPPGWYMDFVVTAIGSDGTKYTSQPVTALFPGSTVATWQQLLWGGISSAQVNPYQY